jgi:hypothetical protein
LLSFSSVKLDLQVYFSTTCLSHFNVGLGTVHRAQSATELANYFETIFKFFMVLANAVIKQSMQVTAFQNPISR